MGKDNQTAALAEAEARTAARLEQIQKQFGKRNAQGRVEGKVCVLTGVGSRKGIGRATAILFAREGAKHLYLLDYNGDELPELAKHIESTYPGVGVTTISADASDPSVIESLCERAFTEHKRLDVFFANAGVATIAPLDAIDPADLPDIFRINITSCFLAVQSAARVMRKSEGSLGKGGAEGSIILTASVAGLRSGAGSIDYSASKAAVISLAQTSANQLAGTGIRVNAVCPGLIETGMTEAMFEMSRQRGTVGKVGQLNPARRYGVAEEIAYPVLFLASDEASYVNGIAMPIDGGLSSSHPVVPGKMA